MLLKNLNKKIILAILSGVVFAFLSSCSDSASLESLVSADPQLQNASDGDQSDTNKNGLNKILVDKETSPSEAEGTKAKKNKDLLLSDTTTNNNKDNPISATKTSSNLALPKDFPEFIPLYPQAELQKIKSGLTNTSGVTFWRSSDYSETISKYYLKEFKANDWAITRPFTLNKKKNTVDAIAVKNGLRLSLTISESTANNSQLVISYKPFIPKISQETAIDTEESKVTENNQELAKKSDRNNKVASNLKTSKTKNKKANSNHKFSDYNKVPEQLRKYVKDVAELGVLSPYVQENNSQQVATFEPNKPITRAEYARWLIAANNLYHGNSPRKKIHVASNSNSAAFKDISPNNPDFGAIQGLAEAGLIPSMLTDDSSNILFQPNAPLKREDLIAWKVPLDIRKILPPASTQAIQDSWGFQDVSNIDPETLKALFGDFQNGDNSNINRIFGYTTIFQPKKPVTRAEAAASLWYFGFQGDGITAPEVLAIDN